jgi:hypothetical protein
MGLQPFVAPRQVLSHPLLDVKAGVGDLFLQFDEVAGDVVQMLVEFALGFLCEMQRLQQALVDDG